MAPGLFLFNLWMSVQAPDQNAISAATIFQAKMSGSQTLCSYECREEELLTNVQKEKSKQENVAT